ncbi:hypothetical protein GGTG_14165 [Gaeumannomyces tritici R3-111a-1]|uniref:Uncharacterized protein n=1 Tax=Gaeumannomyces tritici (strain R3-111a-1) TaxID=644352 RepID=J3PKU6_GAET3|nr:hypothetical protein GGTG_14165 [Gaeumannomyces tritici R3-111a-1]EJT68255.1 hypothetical protein GGTG_14165 [Gaeumannomyces tritici R3-111a-1]
MSYGINNIRDFLINANPALMALANNEHLRNHALRRFDRDPPPYESSTESEEADQEATLKQRVG